MIKPSNIKILLVEDCPVSRVVTLAQLKKLAYEADVAKNGWEALSILAQMSYDIVLIDCQMPVLDGYDTTRRIRQLEGDDWHTIVIAITADGMIENREKCHQFGMNDYLIKPVSQKQLADKLAHWIQVIVWLENAVASMPEKPVDASLCNLLAEGECRQVPGIINLQRLNNITLGNEELQEEILQTFVQDIQMNLSAIKTALSAHDFTTIECKTHQIKGASANVGISCIQALAEQLETLTQQKIVKGIPDLLINIQNYLECVQSFTFKMIQGEALKPETPNIFSFSNTEYTSVPYMAKILIIDDDPSVRLVIKHSLQMLGHQVWVANDGEEGLSKARQLQPHLIICDWIMPVTDGLEVCRQIKSDPVLSLAFFILLTIRGDIKDRVEGLETGADEYLPKPIDMNELRARVHAGLRLQRLTQQLSEANQALRLANQQLTSRNELLESLSLTDQLTGLLNRRALDQALPHMLRQVGNRDAETRYRYLCLFLMDIDHFKQVNDTYGHHVGDWVLRAIAGRLQSNTRPSSLLYRYGGEEFVCITLGLNPQSSLEYAESLRSVIANDPIQVSDHLVVNITLSIGVTIASTANLAEAHELLHQADSALYQAKHEGRNCLCLFPSSESFAETSPTNRYIVAGE